MTMVTTPPLVGESEGGAGLDIHSLSIETTGEGSAEISAFVGAERIIFEVTGAPTELRRSYDPFVVAGFPHAMEAGGELRIAGDAPVSQTLVVNIEEAISLYAQWWPYLTRVSVNPGLVEKGDGGGTGHVGCFFSGGVDSIYSLIENESEITHLVLCHGLDIGADEEERWERTVGFVSDFAETRGKDLILIKTNGKRPLNPRGKAQGHGALLAATGLSLGFRKLLIPASVGLDRLNPWGSHPLLDPLFSNGVSDVIHDSPVARSVKTLAIAETGVGLDTLRVCNRETDYNCGRCEKCLRTMAMLAMLGARAKTLPAIEDARELRGLRLHSDSAYRFWLDNLAFAEKTGRKDFQKEIRKIVRSWRMRNAFRQLDVDYLGGLAIRMKRAIHRGG